MKKVAIIGRGYVGKAIENLLKDFYEIVIHDPVQGFDNKDLMSSCELTVICVPTNQKEDGSCDTSIVEEVLGWVKTPLILIKSTVPPEFLEMVKRPGLCFSPEFIGEGKYFTPYWKYPHPTDMKYHDFMIVGGERKDCIKIIDFFLPVLGPSCRYMKTDLKTAALAKYMINCWGAMKVTFCNEWYEITKAQGVDYQELRELFLLDGRVERMHTAVFSNHRGYDGKCFPKDISALIRFSEDAGYNPRLIKQISASNEEFKR